MVQIRNMKHALRNRCVLMKSAPFILWHWIKLISQRFQCYKIPRITLSEFGNQICERAKKFDRNILEQSIQKTSKDPEESCKVYCATKSGEPITKSWTYPDGTMCRNHESISGDNYFCVNGRCEVRWLLELDRFICEIIHFFLFRNPEILVQWFGQQPFQRRLNILFKESCTRTREGNGRDFYQQCCDRWKQSGFASIGSITCASRPGPPKRFVQMNLLEVWINCLIHVFFSLLSDRFSEKLNRTTCATFAQKRAQRNGQT